MSQKTKDEMIKQLENQNEVVIKMMHICEEAGAEAMKKRILEIIDEIPFGHDFNKGVLKSRINEVKK